MDSVWVSDMSFIEGAFEREILADAIDLCDKRGRVNRDAIGWSRKPIHTCKLVGHWGRKKRWHYWAITSPRALFSMTLATLDYAGIAFAYFVDFETKECIEQTVVVPIPLRMYFPDKVDGVIDFDHKDLRIRLDSASKPILLHADSVEFGGKIMSANFAIERPANHESLNVVIPWGPHHFQFTSKQTCLPASGRVELGHRVFDFDSSESFACLDFGRGMWPYRTSWNWAAGSGRQNGKTVGLNFGAKWTEGTGLTENGVLIDGVLYKIGEEVEFAYDPSDFMKPWSIRTRSSDAVDLEFVPIVDRAAATNALVFKSSVHQLIGHYSGVVNPADGPKVAIDNLVGWAEEHHARW